MPTGLGLRIGLAVVALSAAACSTNGHSSPRVAASTSSSSAATVPTTGSGPQNVTVTAVEKQALTAAFVAFTKLPANEIAGTAPGSVYEAYVPSSGTYWAIARFNPAPGASERTQVGMQDGGDVGFFSHQANAAWAMLTAGGLPYCPSHTVPKDVLSLWGVADDDGATRPRPSRSLEGCSTTA